MSPHDPKSHLHQEKQQANENAKVSNQAMADVLAKKSSPETGTAAAPTHEELKATQENCEKLQRELAELREAHEQLKATSDENWRKLLEAAAARENDKKRHERELEQRQKFAVEKLTLALLPVLDTLEHAAITAQGFATTKASDENTTQFVQALHEGISLTIKMFEDVLIKFGVKKIDPHGLAFDPLHHEAMTMSENIELPDNSVSQVVQKGYLLNDRLVRPARVIVNKNVNET